MTAPLDPNAPLQAATEAATVLRDHFRRFAQSICDYATRIVQLFAPLVCRCPHGDTYRVGPVDAGACVRHGGLIAPDWQP